jgi:hypothetical protein
MPTKKMVQAKLPPVATTVAERLDRIEDLLVEMRGVLDFHLKRIGKLQTQIDLLAAKK